MYHFFIFECGIVYFCIYQYRSFELNDHIENTSIIYLFAVLYPLYYQYIPNYNILMYFVTFLKIVLFNYKIWTETLY